jgi:uncharacterized damage-inducible protein DinB
MQTPTPKEQFLDKFKRETATSLRVLRAYPPDKLDLRPVPTAQSARALAWLLASGPGLIAKALTTGFDWSKPGGKPPAAPESLEAIIKAVGDGNARVMDVVEKTPEDQLAGTVKWPTGPKMMGDMPKIEFMWFILGDHIHHRGQLSVYLRMAGGKVPSIYGPSADEPWF